MANQKAMISVKRRRHPSLLCTNGRGLDLCPVAIRTYTVYLGHCGDDEEMYYVGKDLAWASYHLIPIFSAERVTCPSRIGL